MFCPDKIMIQPFSLLECQIECATRARREFFCKLLCGCFSGSVPRLPFRENFLGRIKPIHNFVCSIVHAVARLSSSILDFPDGGSASFADGAASARTLIGS